jgi:VWFA-related protein
LLSAAISHIAAGQQNPLGGTALFDTLYRACFNQFAKADSASGNVILLFSDGEDNTSHMALKDVVDICQRSNTVLYAFRAEPKAAFSSGPKTLAELASETGGRVFFDDDPEATIDRELRAIEAELRNQYRLIYNPAQMPHDGASHRIDLHAPARVQTLQVRDGYYDSKR